MKALDRSLLVLAFVLPVSISTSYADHLTGAFSAGPFRAFDAFSTGTWSALGVGTNAAVRTLALKDDGRLYVGGDFTSAGGLQTFRLGVWDGTEWSVLGDGSDMSINAIVFDEAGDLYIGGWISSPDGLTTRPVVRWNGSAWETVGGGLVDVVNSLVFDADGNLYAGTTSNTPGGPGTVMRWDGSTWSQVGEGFTGAAFGTSVEALAIDSGGTLYAGGNFTSVGGVAAGYVAKWDGSAWVPLGPGLSGGLLLPGVQAMTFDSSNNLYAGGSFADAGGLAAANVARWDGLAWHGLGAGLPGLVLDLVIDGAGTLYAGGGFLLSTGTGMSGGIAKWNGVSWDGLVSGIGNTGVIGSVEALVLDPEGNLYVGGSFSSVGGTPGFGTVVEANNIAVWDGAAATASERPSEVAGTFALSPPYPNPFNPRTRITATSSTAQYVAVSVFDVLGREVAQLHRGFVAAGEHDFFWDAGGHATGAYVIHAKGVHSSASRRVMLIK